MVRRDVHVIVDLPAVRPARLAERVALDDLTEHVRDFRELLRGARCEPLGDGIRLSFRLDVRGIARLADLVRAEADLFPFWRFRLLAAPPDCMLEIGGEGRAGELAQAVFGELAR